MRIFMRCKWLILCLFFIFSPVLSAHSSDSDWEEMAQLVERADAIIQAQAVQLQELNSQLKQQSTQMQRLQKSYRRCVILSSATVIILTSVMLVKEIKR